MLKITVRGLVRRRNWRSDVETVTHQSLRSCASSCFPSVRILQFVSPLVCCSLVSLHLQGQAPLLPLSLVPASRGHVEVVVAHCNHPLSLSAGPLSSVRNSCLVQPDKRIEANAWASSPSRNSLSTVAVKKTTWDCPLKNHKEAEQKAYKKPNLVVKPLQLVSGQQPQ